MDRQVGDKKRKWVWIPSFSGLEMVREREREKRDLTVEETRTGKWNTVAAERGLKSTPLMGSFWVSKLNARESA